MLEMFSKNTTCNFIFRMMVHFYNVGVLFSPMMGGWAGEWQEKVCPGCNSETIRCRKLILGRDIGWGVQVCNIMCDLDLTFDLAVVTLSLKILSGLYLRNHKV